MVFSDSTFIFVFLPVVLAIYFLLRKHSMAKNLFLLLVSLGFYMWGNPQFVIIMLFSILINYVFAIIISIFITKKALSRLLLAVVIIINLSILFHFKYQVFVSENLNDWFHTNIKIVDIVLPIGISFFTFQAMSYVIDVYRGTVKVQKNPLYLGLYIAFFPQLVAGPIVRYETIEEQITHRTESLLLFSEGMLRFITGLGKKVLLANNMAIIADFVFSNQAGSGSLLSVWLGAIAYTLQIYFDFSGYSDMAIGLGKMFGFEFHENFNYPYIAKNITDFWRRWHISLSTWFRDYVYIPLGGNRCTKYRQIFNLFIVWFLTGVWHGANWTFILWGMIYFFTLILEKYVIKPNQFQNRILKIFYRVFTLMIIIIAWVVFRANSIADAAQYLGEMFGVVKLPLYNAAAGMIMKEFGVFWIAAIIFSFPHSKIKEKLNVHWAMIVKSVALVFVFLISIIYVVNGTYNPFIYFNF